MSAIEMMDPKMDAGMIGNQVNRKVLNFEQAIKVTKVRFSYIYTSPNQYVCVLNINTQNKPSTFK